MHLDVTVLFQVHKVSGEVSISYFQHLLQIIKAYFRIDHQAAHHPQANAVVEHFIKVADRIHTLKIVFAGSPMMPVIGVAVFSH